MQHNHMDDRKLGAFAAVLGLIGMLIHYGAGLISTRLAPETLPAWAVYGSTGTTIVTYMYLLEAAIVVLILLVAIGSGYYIGQQFDVANEYQKIIKIVAGCSAGGVIAGSIALLWSSLTSIGDPNTAIYGSQAREMFIMDMVLPIVVVLQYLATVALVITVGVIAGAALAQFRKEDPSSTASLPADTDGPSSTHQTTGKEASETRSQPSD